MTLPFSPQKHQQKSLPPLPVLFMVLSAALYLSSCSPLSRRNPYNCSEPSLFIQWGFGRPFCSPGDIWQCMEPLSAITTVECCDLLLVTRVQKAGVLLNTMHRTAPLHTKQRIIWTRMSIELKMKNLVPTVLHEKLPAPNSSLISIRLCIYPSGV